MQVPKKRENEGTKQRKTVCQKILLFIFKYVKQEAFQDVNVFI